MTDHWWKSKHDEKHHKSRRQEKLPGRPCPACGGMGDCPTCGGTGCMSCNYTGKCQVCRGTGDAR